jgi:FkbH-like protein
LTPTRLENALAAPSRQAIRRALSPRSVALALGDIQQISARLRQLDSPLGPLKVGVIRSFTTEPLRPYWYFEALLAGFDLELHEAPYGSTILQAAPDSDLARFAPDCTFVFLRWEDLDPGFGTVITAAGASERDAIVEGAVERTTAWLDDLRGVLAGTIVVALLPPMTPPELGHHEPMSAQPEGEVRRRVRDGLTTHFRDRLPDTHLCDLDDAVATCGRNEFFDPRLWYSTRFPFGVHGAQEVVRRFMAYPLVALRSTVKCIVLDGDNTLWGGVLGEDGLDGVSLGPDYPGSVYTAFQRRLAAFRERGILLALCTRNDPGDVERLLQRHPHAVLRAEHFAAVSAGWGSKPEGVTTIARDLNIGLDAVVYVDDSPQECHEVELSLPQVEVVATPTRLVDLPACLDDLPRLEVITLTDEDRRRQELYAQERVRRNSIREGGSAAKHLAGLDMRMTIAIDERAAAGRVAQLTQRTNQFNLTTRRYSENEILALVDDDAVLVAHCSLRDIFGDSGIVGVAIVRSEAGGVAEFDTFLLSCRVIGRMAETAFLAGVLDRLAARDVTRVRGRYLPTPKNHLVEDFWTRHGFADVDDTTAETALPAPLPVPAPIGVEFADAIARESV